MVRSVRTGRHRRYSNTSFEDEREELKMLTRQKTREIMRSPEKEGIIEDTYDEMIAECQSRIDG